VEVPAHAQENDISLEMTPLEWVLGLIAHGGDLFSLTVTDQLFLCNTTNDPTTEQLALHAYATGSSHVLTGTYLSEPVWSPDGKQIAYYNYINTTFDLWIANVSYDAKTGKYSLQGDPVQVTTGGVDAASHPVWTN